jgi:hypothetical protein
MSALARICVACRTAYAAGDVCMGGDGHEVVALDDPAQRRRMIDAVWGDLEARRKLHASAVSTQRRMGQLIVGGGVSGFVGGVWLGPVGAATLCAIGGTFVGGLIAHASRPRMPSAYPIGAPAPAWPKVSARGRVRGAIGVESPATGESCAAWSLVLRYDGVWGERVMLRAGASAGLEIALDGGEVLRIPAGPVALTESAQQVDDLAAARVQAIVNGLDPRGRAGEAFAPLPYNVVGEALLFVGDRIEVVGPMDRVLAPAPAHAIGDGALYRDAPPSRLVPHGLPTLRRY